MVVSIETLLIFLSFFKIKLHYYKQLCIIMYIYLGGLIKYVQNY